MSMYKGDAPNFLSLARETRDEIYTHLLSVPEPICFDCINGFMPEEEIAQWGLIMMHPQCINPSIAAEAREIFYRGNTFKLKCADILQFLDFTPFQPTQWQFFDAKSYIARVIVLVERHLAGENVISPHYPVHLLQRLFACPSLREIKIEMRDPCSCMGRCSTIDQIARELKKESTSVKIIVTSGPPGMEHEEKDEKEKGSQARQDRNAIFLDRLSAPRALKTGPLSGGRTADFSTMITYRLQFRHNSDGLHFTPMFRSIQRAAQLSSHLKARTPIDKVSNLSILSNSKNMSHLYEEATPAEVKNAKGLHLITQSTPNGQKVQIMLEELHEIYGTEWTTTLINIMTNEQKKDWFLRLNPNGRIPVIIDNTQSPPFPVMETSAELLYLLKFADKNDVFGFKDELERNQALQWLFFWHGSGAPYQGQMNHFGKFAKEKIPYAIERFRNETLRVYGVLEIQLSGKYTGSPREYLAGEGQGKYSVADIGTWPWVKGYEFSGFSQEDMKPFPHLLKWIERIAERPAVKRGTGEKYQQK